MRKLPVIILVGIILVGAAVLIRRYVTPVLNAPAEIGTGSIPAQSGSVPEISAALVASPDIIRQTNQLVTKPSDDAVKHGDPSVANPSVPQ